MREFQKISEKEYKKYIDLFLYDDIKIPERQTVKSCGYDFYIPYKIEIEPFAKVKIYSGIKVSLEDDEFLALVIRSSMAIKKDLILTNQIGIIDSDYYNNMDNEGHIIIAITNNSDKKVVLSKHERIVQGIILKYETVNNDDVNKERLGGFGSTSQK